MRNFSPPDERRSQGLRTHRQTLIMSSLSCISGTKLSQHTPTSSPTGTKLTQHAQNCPFQPVLPEQGELCTARTTTPPSRENFVPHLAPNPVQNSPSTPHQQPNRYKTLPTHPKLPISASFARAGRTLYRIHPPRPPAGRTLYRAQCQTRYKTLPAPPFYSGSAKKFAQNTSHHNRTAKKFAQHT